MEVTESGELERIGGNDLILIRNSISDSGEGVLIKTKGEN